MKLVDDLILAPPLFHRMESRLTDVLEPDGLRGNVRDWLQRRAAYILEDKRRQDRRRAAVKLGQDSGVKVPQISPSFRRLHKVGKATERGLVEKIDRDHVGKLLPHRGQVAHKGHVMVKDVGLLRRVAVRSVKAPRDILHLVRVMKLARAPGFIVVVRPHVYVAHAHGRGVTGAAADGVRQPRVGVVDDVDGGDGHPCLPQGGLDRLGEADSQGV
mmetsp:Transcript_36625/g.110679  ORF Transcript_36625/g.110679 Transcript_36625/m.110679 type:complete len:215 (+) Transcript_36625:701-1345(+)